MTKTSDLKLGRGRWGGMTIPSGAITDIRSRNVACTCRNWIKKDEPEWHWPDCAKVKERNPMSTEKLTYAIQRAKNNGVTASDVQAIVDDVFGCAMPEVAAEYAEPVEPAETSTDDVEQQ